MKEAQPKIKVIYMSGYLEYNRGDSEFLEDGFFVQKPFSRDGLVRKVDEVLGWKPSEKPSSNGASSNGASSNGALEKFAKTELVG